MDDDEVFAAVAGLVAAGEYRDTMFGRPGFDIDPADSLGSLTRNRNMQRMYSRGSEEYERAKANGWIQFLPPLCPASLAAVEEAEALAGAPLPPLLRRLYLEVGNGGFGPGYGVLGLRDGHETEHRTALAGLGEPYEGPGVSPQIPMTICNWGCAVTSELDLADGQIWGSDPNPDPTGVSPLFPQHLSVGEWLQRWLDRHLHQPCLVEDPDTGLWRGATDAEHEEWIAEARDPDDPDEW